MLILASSFPPSSTHAPPLYNLSCTKLNLLREARSKCPQERSETARDHPQMMAIVNKVYCSPMEVALVVRRRPHAVSGGGFVATDCSSKRAVFRVDGCGVLGTSGELIVRDGDGDALLLIRRKAGGIVQAMSIHKKWKGYTYDYEGAQKLLFSIKEPNSSSSLSCFSRNASSTAIKISLEPRKVDGPDGIFHVKGHFPDRDCSIVDSGGNAVAQIQKEMAELMASKDVYRVIVKAGIDQAFVCGVVAVLDHIYGESTAC
ncbi:protein LURP-one-related 6 [Rhodamnia argentea]|uniref:Protein LURP-one-related 6 n=1 Tax=Rhodamnia argentea TaxID=178133 RepID=A0A8B8PUS7_9MYRT|nr:protein LURP-one-related 6 [Rhodamnia argentea]